MKTGTEEIDWSRTKAYAMGLNALYINLAGRERFGIVQPGPEREAVIQQLREAAARFSRSQERRGGGRSRERYKCRIARI